MPPSISDDIDSAPYLCGRLFAELENLQREANETQLNATITDRYYAVASTNPRLALPRVLELAQAHLKKLRRTKRDDAYFAISRRIDELVERAGGETRTFPGALAVIDQGRFAIGYHHQRAERARQARRSKEDKKGKTPE